MGDVSSNASSTSVSVSRGDGSEVADDSLLATAAAWYRDGRGVAVATVVATWGSSPRPAGSQLVIDDRGHFAGSVSGGCVEAAVIEAAGGVIASGAPALLEFGVSNARAWEVGLACGGRIQVFVERVE